MSNVLKTHVHVTKKDGSVSIFEAGTAVPGWAKQLITNPAAFVEDEAEKVEEKVEGLIEGQTPPAQTDEEKASTDAAAAEAANTAAAANDELRAKLVVLGQPTEGTHEELVARLAEHGE
jgi:hypothetical protein